MRRLSSHALLAGLALATATGAALATPSTNVWNPNTDIQAPKTLHLGVDNYFSVKSNKNNSVAFPTDVGLTYGLGSGIEIGMDLFEPTSSPVQFNAKWGLPEKGKSPAFAIGIQNVGTSHATASDIAYALVAKTFPSFGRITLGGYTGRKSVIGTPKSGVIAAYDRQFTPKWWGSVDYASGDNAYGALSVGAAYKVAPNVGVLFGYVMFNNSSITTNDTFTTQVDIDF